MPPKPKARDHKEQFDHRHIVAWADPWPVTFGAKARDTRWTIELLTMAQCLKFKVWWRRGSQEVTAKVAFELITERNAWNKEHHIASLVRHDRLSRPVIMVHDGRIVDGNHRLMALAMAKYRGRVLVLRSDYDA